MVRTEITIKPEVSPPASPLEGMFPPGSEGYQIVNQARLVYLDYQLGLAPEAELDEFIDNPKNSDVIDTHDRRLGDKSVMGYVRGEVGGLKRPQLLERRQAVIGRLQEPSVTVVSEVTLGPRHNKDPFHGKRFRPRSGDFASTSHALGSAVEPSSQQEMPAASLVK